MAVTPTSAATFRVVMASAPRDRSRFSAAASTLVRSVFVFTVYTLAMSTLYATTAAGVVALLCSLAALPSPQRDPAGLAGVWKVSLHEQDGTDLDFRMTIETSGRQPVTWEAYSRPGAAREIVGGGKAILGSLFGKLPPHGAL